MLIHSNKSVGLCYKLVVLLLLLLLVAYTADSSAHGWCAAPTADPADGRHGRPAAADEGDGGHGQEEEVNRHSSSSNRL